MELPDLPRYVAAHGIAADPAGWRRALGDGVAFGHDRARLIAVCGDADPAATRALALAHPEHALLVDLEREALVAAIGRAAVRFSLQTLAGEPPDLEGALLLPHDADLAHVPTALREELAGRRVWAVYVDDRPVSFAYAPWRSAAWFDGSIDTLPEARQLGLGAIVASALIADERAAGRAPVWGAALENAASQRLARALGFAPHDEIWVLPP